MMRVQAILYRWRWPLVALWGATVAFGLLWVWWPVAMAHGWVREWAKDDPYPYPAGLVGVLMWVPDEVAASRWGKGDIPFAVATGAYTGAWVLVLAAVIAFPLGRRRRAGRLLPPLNELSFIGALADGVLCLASIAIALEFTHVWAGLQPYLDARPGPGYDGSLWLGPGVAAVGAVASLVVTAVLGRPRSSAQVRDRLAARLLLASTVVVAVASGLQAWRAHQLCRGFTGFFYSYCFGSYSGLVLGATVFLWASGIVILPTLCERRSLFPPGSCPRCGYDLRGTIAAGRTQCPECGAKVAAGQG
jgi:hypothetical protein